MKEFDELIEIMSKLRGEHGCKWDREQTHRTLLPYLLEEAHETADAIASENSDWSAEELGDLLLQIIFHAQIASETGEYDMKKIISGLSAKLIRRHPHVFAGAVLQTKDELDKMWNEVKAEEKKAKGTREEARSLIPLVKPGVLSVILEKKGILPKTKEYNNTGATEDETGRKLLEILKEALENGIDPERALWKEINKYKK